MATKNDGNRDGSASGIDLIPAKPMVKRHILERWFLKQYPTLHSDEDGFVGSNGEGGTTGSSPSYKMYRTQFSSGSGEGDARILRQAYDLLRLRATWRALAFGFVTFAVCTNWTATELLLPPFLERRFGEGVPIYMVQSINLFGCLLLPPVVGAVTGGMEDFSIVMPGLWIMALSPIFMALSPNMVGACIWQVVLTIGEVLWSPRQYSWMASLAPTGAEGLFFAIASSRAMLGPLTDMLMGAINARYNANCPECRDQYGHFCASLNVTNDGVLKCSSVQELCNVTLVDEAPTCPRTCLECPSAEPTDASACWYLLTIASLLTPLCTWLLLPFLRGVRGRDEGCYGVCSSTKRRWMGVFGAVDDGDGDRRRFDGRRGYGRVGRDSHNSDDEGGKGEEIELA